MLRRIILLFALGATSFGPSSLGHGKDIHDYYPKAKPYPFNTCLVTDEKLGERGKPYVFKHSGREIKLCCKTCRDQFKKDPKKFIQKLQRH